MLDPSVAQGEHCKCCGHVLNGVRLELGSLPACNRYRDGAIPTATHPLTVAQCPGCTLVQLAVYPPVDFVTPRVPWIRYNEPEQHLDDLAERLQAWLPEGARVLGLGPYDLPLGTRMTRPDLRYRHIDLLHGLPARAGFYPYLETIQQQLPMLGIESGDHADLLICRGLLEHSHEPLAALAALKCRLAPSGRLLLEVPDSEKFLARGDYSALWEEHICYFTETSLRFLLARAGLRIAAFMRYSSVIEDILVVCAEPAELSPLSAPDTDTLFVEFTAAFPACRRSWQERVHTIRRQGGRIALFGAGHQAIMFVNAFGLQAAIDAIADDQPDKQGHYAPGIDVPIVSSAMLAETPAIDHWLLAISSKAQSAVRAKFGSLDTRGVKMQSIFPETAVASVC